MHRARLVDIRRQHHLVIGITIEFIKTRAMRTQIKKIRRLIDDSQPAAPFIGEA